MTTVCVANVDTLSAALELGDACALSHANADTPGGRYRHGGRAQEEDLCRCLPQLWPSLVASGAYPLDPEAALLTRGSGHRKSTSHGQLSLRRSRANVERSAGFHA